MSAWVIFIAVLLGLNLAVAYRALDLMRYQNRTRLMALAVKATLNTLSVATVLAQPILEQYVQSPWHALRIIPLFANPIALVLLFRSPRTSPWLLKTTLITGFTALSAVVWYVAGTLQLVPMPKALNGWFPIQAADRFGHMSLAYLGITLAVLATLMAPRIKHARRNRSSRWELLYLANGILRGLILLAIVVATPRRGTQFDSAISLSMSLSVVLDSLILLRFGTNREVFFHSEHGLPLVAPWNPDIERLIQTLKQPSAYTNPRYSLLDAGHTLAWSSTKVARTLHDATGQSFKDVLTHYRRNHFDHLTLNRPDLTKLERLKQSGFASYASFHYAERRSTS
jgi:AraC-like DNA-binding protein